MWIQTLHGRRFDYSDCSTWVFDPEEVATVLSRLPRFLGHTKFSYSVAQHCVLMSREASRMRRNKGRGLGNIKLASLLHDAPEAFIGDMPSPLKQYLKSVGDDGAYRELEVWIERWLERVHALPHLIFEHDDLKLLDLRMLATEGRDLMDPDPIAMGWQPLPPPFDMTIERWTEDQAKTSWLDEYMYVMEYLPRGVTS